MPEANAAVGQKMKNINSAQADATNLSATFADDEEEKQQVDD